MGCLERYVARNVLLTVIVVSVFLLVLTGLVTFIDQMRYIGRGSIDFSFLIVHLLLQLPGLFVLFFPIAVLLGGVVALGMMARNSELIILQSVGMSRARIVFAALKFLFPVIVLVFLAGEFIVPRLQQYAESRYNYYASNGNISITYDGMWLREGNSFIGVRYTMSDNSLMDIVRYDFADGKLQSVTIAKRGVYEDGNWVMQDVTTTHFKDNAVVPGHQDSVSWKLNLNPERVSVLSLSGLNLTISSLMDYIDYLEENNQDAASYRLELYNKLFAPFTVVVMLLLAASTVFGPLRTVPMGTRIVIGIALGFGYYVANQFGAPFSLVYGIPPVIGALLPSVLFFLLALYLLRAKR